MLNQGAEDLLKVFMTYMEEYTRRIDEEFGIDQSELLSLWEQVITGEEEDPPPPPPSSPPPVKTKETVISDTPTKMSSLEKKDSPANEDFSQSICPYILTKGNNKGSACGSKSKVGMYCTRHKKYAGDSPNPRKTLPPPRRSIVSSKHKNQSKKSTDIILHKGPGESLYHRPTGLVLTQDKIVVGRWVRAIDHPEGIDEVKPLNEEDIELAKKHMFPFRTEEDNKTAVSEDDPDTTTQEAIRKVTRSLSPFATKELQDSLSSVIAKTNEHATDVDAILSELQIRGSPHDQESEKVDNESDSDEYLEEED